MDAALAARGTRDCKFCTRSSSSNPGDACGVAAGVGCRAAGPDARRDTSGAACARCQRQHWHGVISTIGVASASKKSMHATEQDRADVAAARALWKAHQGLLDPTRLVFIDETGTSTNMSRLRGRCHRGRRLVAKVPHGHWKITTFVAGLRHDGITAPFVIDEPMNASSRRERAVRLAR
jgi:hypothetical protein